MYIYIMMIFSFLIRSMLLKFINIKRWMILNWSNNQSHKTFAFRQYFSYFPFFSSLRKFSWIFIIFQVLILCSVDWMAWLHLSQVYNNGVNCIRLIVSWTFDTYVSLNFVAFILTTFTTLAGKVFVVGKFYPIYICAI